MSLTKRTELHNKLIALLGSRNVYFQPPESIKLKYPCIIYHRYRFDPKYADDLTYLNHQAYEVTIISKDPDFDLPEKIPFEFKNCRYNRHFISDNLNHDVFTIYY